jgi:hypothetical protein
VFGHGRGVGQFFVVALIVVSDPDAHATIVGILPGVTLLDQPFGEPTVSGFDDDPTEPTDGERFGHWSQLISGQIGPEAFDHLRRGFCNSFTTQRICDVKDGLHFGIGRLLDVEFCGVHFYILPIR